MRSTTTSAITLKYPDEVGFAFNPCIFIAEGSNIASMNIVMTDNDANSTNVTYDAFKGSCYADVREYLQALYDTKSFGDISYTTSTKSKVGKSMTFEVNIMLQDGTNVHFDVEVYLIWGALILGGKDVFSGFRTLTWFRGYPFTFGIFSTGGSLL